MTIHGGDDLKFPHLGSELNSMWDLARQEETIHFSTVEDFKIAASIQAARPAEEIVQDLKQAKFIFGFIDQTCTRESFVDPLNPCLWFLIMPVDKDLSVAIVNVNNTQKNISALLTAEYSGVVEMLGSRQLPFKFVESWMRVRQPFKFLCVEEVVNILKDEKLTQAYLSYSRYFNKKQYHLWKQEFGINVRICRSRRHMISTMVKKVLGHPV